MGGKNYKAANSQSDFGNVKSLKLFCTESFSFECILYYNRVKNIFIKMNVFKLFL